MKTLTRPLVEMYNIAYAGRDLIPYRNSERFIKHFDVEKGAIFMAVEREDSVVGLFELFFNEKTAYVGNLAVAPSHRGTSVADEMCRMGFDAMTDRGFLKMEAHMSDKNLPILRYIERYGLVKTGETERFTLEIKE
ncbi:MAG: GNAT family N-acetyltransferase [Desulfobacteraceae bacterium]|nr:GNAT family N-acetyltransferase [Desulfobacteraceae bacterium]